MFGLFKKKEAYPDLGEKYHTILRRDLNVKLYYADAFIKNVEMNYLLVNLMLEKQI